MSTLLRPERLARPVRVDDSAALLTEITHLCQVWGGAGQPLLPVRNDSMPNSYTRLLDTEQIDGIGGHQQVAVKLPFRVEEAHPEDSPTLLVATHEPLERWRPVEVCDLDPDDPWKPIYATVLGMLPDTPSAELSNRHYLREGLRFEDVVPIQRVTVRGSLEDLVARTTNYGVLTPRQFANIYLTYGLAPDTSFFGEVNQVIPEPRTAQRAAGPNLIVAVTAGSVEDLALLWNLRAAHGDHRVMPIGIPTDQITPDALRTLQTPEHAAMFGGSGGRCHLTSSSVAAETLDKLASGSPARTVPYQDILTFGPAPGRLRTHIGTWQEGRTRLDPLTDSDREILRHARTAVRSIPLILDVQVTGFPLPTDPTMRGTEMRGRRFQAGAAQVTVPLRRRQATIQVTWPSSWTCLAAVAQTHGLDVRESSPGLAAATLIRALQDTAHARWLAHHGLIALLYRMAERSGMSWWKRRWTETQRRLRELGVDPATLEEAAKVLGRDDPVVAPAGEGRAVPFQEFRTTLGNEAAAQHWVSWAERRHLLVRGADIKCPTCQATAWLPMAAIPPPVPCAGCGREILHPYGPRELRFTYRLGESLRRVLETDSLGHVLALRWLVELLDNHGLVGAHPGVEFVDPDTGTVVGEGDVVLLFADGSLIPIEVKRRGAGVDDKTQLAMDTVAAALSAPWDVLVVTEPARDCEPIRTAERRLPNHPRLILTTDQLFNDFVLWALGGDPFEWNPLTAEQDISRDAALADWLRRNNPDRTWNRVSETLLDRNLGALHTRRGTNDESARTAGPDEQS